MGEMLLEIFGAVSGLLYVWLEIKHKRAMWAVGFVMSVSYVVVFGIKGLYASMGLYVYFLVMSVYGWRKWSEQVKSEGGEVKSEELRAVRMSGKQAGVAGGMLISSFVVMWAVLRWLTDHPAPAADAAVTALNVAATWLLAHSVLEQWILLIVANALAIGLYAWSGLWFTTGLYIVLLVSSFIGYSAWRRKIH
ncbi:MAG: nicotinamide riboside transporter PnuC [Bacteroidales bacterium]|jgi:nicotinamide mononucleotide transporter|nr:nicotinamide riboside transporter PnuC [Bacteroidales bacterium]HHV40561.1 nicotinamide mononucleotide transporter [Bacteroidales bacterium]